MSMLDLHRPAAIALSPAERAALVRAAGSEVTEMGHTLSMRRHYGGATVDEIADLEHDLATLNAARHKLGAIVEEETCRPTTTMAE